jgi:hypothetical protein
MKRILFTMLLVVVIMVIFAPVMAFAADAEAVTAEESGGFYDWPVLATYAGCLAATLVFTQFLKKLWPEKWPTQYLSFVVAYGLWIAANAFIGNLSAGTAILGIVNAVIVALAANGTYNNIKEAKTVETPDEAHDGSDGSE